MTDSSDALKDRKRSDEKIREQRAESLFRYIEVKKKELRDKKTELLKAIIVKQRLKIRQSDVEWEKKRAQLRPLNRSPSKVSPIQFEVDHWCSIVCTEM